MKKIIVSVTNDLTTDQRVAKVCNTLFNGGFDILLVGRTQKDSLPIQRDYPTKRLSLFFNKGFLFYAEYNFRLFFFLLFTKKNILLSNDLDTLLPNFLISKLQRKKLVYDSHELFPEVPELIHKPVVKKTWVSLEKFILPKLKNCYTVCKSIADFYDEKYLTHFKVIKNYPHLTNTQKGVFPFDKNQKKIILYQGAINVGRGLELMIETMQLLPNCYFVIVGKGDIDKKLKQLVTSKNINNVKFLGKLTPETLLKITPHADLGISLEEDLGLNYKFALPNKIFDYIQAEVPIIISDLPEMKHIVLEYGVGEIVKNRTPENLANQIKELLEKDFLHQLKKAKKALIWEHQEKKLLSIFKE
ncbi:glycosyltransferase [Polaribacter sp. R77954]|uniref:glycosyltransferase n=1 Tax=Polaribacter sp. R77954 TaxID=3093870 RepID=UPI0037CAA78A